MNSSKWANLSNMPISIDEGLQLTPSEYIIRNGEGLEVPNQHDILGSPQEGFSPEQLPSRSPVQSPTFLSKEEQKSILHNTFSSSRSRANIPPRRRQRGGLAPTTILLGVLVLALISAVAALGAVLGSKVTFKSHSPNPIVTVPVTVRPTPSSGSSSSPTGASSSPTSPPTDDASRCDNGSVYESATRSTYSRICDSDILVNAVAGAKGAVWKLNPIHSLEQCIDTCAVWSLEAPEYKSKWKCIAVSWAYDGSKVNTCWLKNRTDDHGHKAFGIHSAILKQA